VDRSRKFENRNKLQTRAPNPVRKTKDDDKEAKRVGSLARFERAGVNVNMSKKKEKEPVD
jgi:hypothetical protein